MRQKSDRCEYVKTEDFYLTQDHFDRFNRNQEKAIALSKTINELLFANQ